MKISLHSDIHNEHRDKDVRISAPKADVIILAGDCHDGMNIYRYACDVANNNPQVDVLWIAGNHEHYGHDINEIREYWQSQQQQSPHPRVQMLDNSSVEYGDISILGTTLWSDFSAFLPKDAPKFATMRACKRGIADFHVIYDKVSSTGLMTPQYMCDMFYESRKWLNDKLTMNAKLGLRSVVVTHFAPTQWAQHKGFPVNDLGNYFNSNVDDLMIHHQDNIECWLFAHTHCNGSNGNLLYNIPIHSNMLGYPKGEDASSGYDPDFLIEI